MDTNNPKPVPLEFIYTNFENRFDNIVLEGPHVVIYKTDLDLYFLLFRYLIIPCTFLSERPMLFIHLLKYFPDVKV
jgi:hypothetical protein